MAGKNDEKKPSLASLTLVIAMFGTIAILILLPLPIFQAVLDAEQRQLIHWLGMESDQWIMNQIFDLVQAINKEVSQLLETTEPSGNDKMDRWLMERGYAATLWAHVILYRSGMFLMWALFALPCVLAAMNDGHYRRQISKASFTSQSPMLHKRGVDLAKLVFVSMVAWLFVPFYLSTWIAPVAIAGLSFAWWLWVANLQKRL
jgi:hypothetical protein